MHTVHWARDALAGLVFATMDIPQVLGYARIAGMPAVTGLYTAIFPILAFSIFGASKHLVVAADSATATILSSRLSQMALPASEHYMALAGMVALLSAGLLLLARLLRLGFLSDFLSRTVLVGFLAGVGVQVSSAMLGEITGLTVHATSTIGQLEDWFGQLHQLSVPTVLLSVIALSAIYLEKKFRTGIPVSFLLVISSILGSRFAHFSGYGITVLGHVAGGIPHWHLLRVSWQETVDLLPVAASCVVIILAQSAATARAFAERYQEEVDEDGNISGLAAANVLAAFSGTFVVNGSPTQTAMAEQAGARSQWAQMVFAGVVLLVLLFLSNWLQYLPRAILGSIVFSIATGLINTTVLMKIYQQSRVEFILALTTALAVIVLGVEHGILMAVTISLLLHVEQSYQPHSMMLAANAEGRWEPVEVLPGNQTAPGLIVYRFDADLFFANALFFTKEIRKLVYSAPQKTDWLVIDAAAITDIDYSAAQAVGELFQELTRCQTRVVLARVNPYLGADLQRHGLVELIGNQYIFSTLHQALEMIHGSV